MVSSIEKEIADIEKERNIPDHAPSEIRILAERLYNWLHLPGNESLLVKFAKWHLGINDPGFQKHIIQSYEDWYRRDRIASEIISNKKGRKFDPKAAYQELIKWTNEYNKTAILTEDETLSLRRFMNLAETNQMRGLGWFWAVKLCRIVIRLESGMELREYYEL